MRYLWKHCILLFRGLASTGDLVQSGQCSRRNRIWQFEKRGLVPCFFFDYSKTFVHKSLFINQEMFKYSETCNSKVLCATEHTAKATIFSERYFWLKNTTFEAVFVFFFCKTWLPCTGRRYWSISVVPNFSGYLFRDTHCTCSARFHSADCFCVLCWYVLSILSALYFIPNIYMQLCKLYNFLSLF